MYIPPGSNIIAQPCLRWRRICELADKRNIEFRPEDDRTIVVGVQFKRALDKALERGGDDDAERAVCSRFPGIYRAYVLWTASQPLKYAIEAYIVADLSAKQIAKLTRQAWRTIDWYEKLFFDVRAECENEAFVTLVLLPETSYGNVSERSIDALWKLAARFLGPQVVTDMIGKCVANPATMDKFATWALTELRKRLAALATSVKIHSDNYVELLQATGIVKKDEGEEGVAAATEELKRTLLQAFRFTMAVDEKVREEGVSVERAIAEEQ